VAIRGVGDGDHGHDAEAQDHGQGGEHRLHYRLEPLGETEAQHRCGEADDDEADGPDLWCDLGHDDGVKDAERE
jgi:hypothetical protein